jgi:hypothetical protein
LYKELFALTYEKYPSEELNNPSEELNRYGAIHGPSKFYRSLSRWSKRANASSSPLEFLQLTRAKRKEITDLVRAATGIDFKEGDILIDIPPDGRDQVDNIFVDCDDVIRSIHEVSFMGHAVRSSFAYWTRTARIFIAPDASERCERRGLTREMLGKMCSQILEDMVRTENPQKEFTF